MQTFEGKKKSQSNERSARGLAPSTRRRFPCERASTEVVTSLTPHYRLKHVTPKGQVTRVLRQNQRFHSSDIPATAAPGGRKIRPAALLLGLPIYYNFQVFSVHPAFQSKAKAQLQLGKLQSRWGNRMFLPPHFPPLFPPE